MFPKESIPDGVKEKMQKGEYVCGITTHVRKGDIITQDYHIETSQTLNNIRDLGIKINRLKNELQVLEQKLQMEQEKLED